MFTNNRLDFRQGQTMTERVHSSAISKGVPSFVTSGLEYNEGTGNISSGFFVNCGAFGRLGNENEEQQITPNYTGFLVIKSNWRGGVTSDSELIESSTRIDSKAGDTSEELYFTLYELENGLIKRNDKGTIIGDYRHNQFIKTVDVDLSTGGFGFSVNGVSSPFVNVDLTGITQRVLTLEDLNISDSDFIDTEDNDTFVDFLMNLLPENSILMLSAGVGSNISKNFPFGESGLAVCYRFSDNNKYVGKIDYTVVGDTPNTTDGNVWSQDIYKEITGEYKTRGYIPLDGNSKIIELSTPNDTEYNFPGDYSKFDSFHIMGSNDTFTEHLSSSLVEGFDLGKLVYLTASASGTFIQVGRGVRITEDNIYVGSKTSEEGTSTSRLKGIVVVADQKSRFKNSESVLWASTRKSTMEEKYD